MSDLFELFNKIDSNDYNYYKNLSIESKKSIYFYNVQRWMTGISDSKQILFINHFVNSKIWSFYKYPELVYKLLCVSSTGKKRYKWLGKKKKDSKNETLKLISHHYDCSQKDAIEYLQMLDNADILELTEVYALDKETITKIKKEIK